jgi:hypothetical protein
MLLIVAACAALLGTGWIVDRRRDDLAYGEPAPAWALTGEAPIIESKNNGDLVVVALGSYRKDHGTYPARLRDLVPKYVAQLPRPWNRAGCWHYVNEDHGNRFELSFGTDPQYDDSSAYPHPRWMWDSKAGEWFFFQ